MISCSETFPALGCISPPSIERSSIPNALALLAGHCSNQNKSFKDLGSTAAEALKLETMSLTVEIITASSSETLLSPKEVKMTHQPKAPF